MIQFARFVAILSVLALATAGCAPMYVVRGFSSQSDYEFAQQFKDVVSAGSSLTQIGVDQLKTVGIKSRAQFDAIAKEMKSSAYSYQTYPDLYDAVIAYIDDRRRAEGTKNTPEQVRRKRLAEEQEREAKRKREHASEYPYTLLVSCEIGGDNVGLEPCFFGGRHGINTQFEIRNGSEYGMYQPWELQRLGSSSGRGLAIELRRNFAVRAQNAGENFLLTFRVYDTASGNLIYTKSAAQYGSIYITQ